MIATDEAIGYLCFCMGWNGGVFPVYLDGKPSAITYLRGSRTQIGEQLARRAAAWEHHRSAQVEIALPESKPDNGGPGRVTVLWCWLRQKESVQRAVRFAPAPSVVLRMGSSCRRLLLWALSEPVSYFNVTPANKRIAYALHAPQTTATPDKLRVPVPGTFLRVDRVRPAPVLVTKLDVESAYTAAQIVDGLREPPRPWAQRQRESGAWR